MGRKDKHKQGQSRNNPVFKVANGKLAKHKGKAKEVTTKLKNLSKHNAKDALGKIDAQMKTLQGKSVSLSGRKVVGKEDTKIQPVGILGKELKANVDALVDVMDTTNMKAGEIKKSS